jgi:hypothetical protein
LPPPGDEQWDLTSNGIDGVDAVLIGGVCIAGADGFELAANFNPMVDPDSADHDTAACAGTASVLGFTGTDQVDGAIRWTLGGLPVSDWSTNKSVFIA